MPIMEDIGTGMRLNPPGQHVGQLSLPEFSRIAVGSFQALTQLWSQVDTLVGEQFGPSLTPET
jgi:hypothetical protein